MGARGRLLSADEVPDRGTVRALWRFRSAVRPELGRLLLGVLLRVGELVADLALPWPLALVIDDLLRGEHDHQSGILPTVAAWVGGSPAAVLTVAAVAVLVVNYLSGLCDYLGDTIMNSAGERITARIRADTFGHLERLPMSYHDRQSVGELTNRVMTDTSRIESSLLDLFTDLLPALFTLVGTAALLFAMDWRLGLVGVCSAPVLFHAAARYARGNRTSSTSKRVATGELTGFVTESLRGIRTVQAFGNQQVEAARFAASNGRLLRVALDSVESSARYTPALQLVTALGTAVLLWVGGYGALHRWWSVAVLVVAVQYVRNLQSPMRTLAKLMPCFTQGAASAERISAILDRPAAHPGVARVLPDRAAGRVELRDVGLDYGRGPVLAGLSLVVEPGERIVLSGESGAGKSTTLSLVGGLYPPTSGVVLLDGLSVPDVPEHWLHRHVAMVLQDTFLFSGTLADNLRYGRPDATDEQVRRVAELARVTEFADRLPDGLDTRLSRDGIGLSGGQRRRVGIARALLLDAPVVLLDEPTVGLDAAAEELVVAALVTLVQGRTVIMATHQPTLTRLATRTVHLRRGESGLLPVPGARTQDAGPTPGS